MGPPLDDVYFTWLYSQVGSIDNKNLASRHRKLMRLLFLKEFIWIDREGVSHDENRALDGIDLRADFLRENRDLKREARQTRWAEAEGCSVLEMLVALAKKMAYNDLNERPARDWFWVMIRNLDLDIYTDATDVPPSEVNYVLDRLINREYESDGTGGLFPLSHPDEDQRDVELWYQASAYLLERLERV